MLYVLFIWKLIALLIKKNVEIFFAIYLMAKLILYRTQWIGQKYGIKYVTELYLLFFAELIDDPK